ncbi:MAG: NAAT family transporter [Rhodospirillaceae bacterium]|nr:NAAT family transporter [Rhodospirillaceae bacterium]
MIDLALAAFVNFIVIIDPIGVVPFFMSHTAHLDPAGRRATALKSITIAAAILLVFTVIGQPLLHYLGVSVAAFRIAGGVLLLLLAVDMVLVKESGIRATTPKEEEEATHRPDVAVFPLAVPLIAGPGAITSVILLQSQNAASLAGRSVVAGVMIAVLLITGLAFLVASPIMRMLGVTGINVMTRVLGIILAALAVSNILEGLRVSFPVLG